ncbi:hypothetical protein Nepgr_007855 [Nepenthes gracilis]|uniref:Uncharacterized protein n=1 Tax=Nepenthes gracilis TaxID=150966 RepID=A0AAD3XIU8_NEPGR|nr:hypothetical protein Nepgr_007855 [Nepenthes gracilis]
MAGPSQALETLCSSSPPNLHPLSVGTSSYSVSASSVTKYANVLCSLPKLITASFPSPSDTLESVSPSEIPSPSSSSSSLLIEDFPPISVSHHPLALSGLSTSYPKFGNSCVPAEPINYLHPSIDSHSSPLPGSCPLPGSDSPLPPRRVADFDPHSGSLHQLAKKGPILNGISGVDPKGITVSPDSQLSTRPLHLTSSRSYSEVVQNASSKFESSFVSESYRIQPGQGDSILSPSPEVSMLSEKARPVFPLPEATSTSISDCHPPSPVVNPAPNH